MKGGVGGFLGIAVEVCVRFSRETVGCKRFNPDPGPEWLSLLDSHTRQWAERKFNPKSGSNQIQSWPLFLRGMFIKSRCNIEDNTIWIRLHQCYCKGEGRRGSVYCLYHHLQNFLEPSPQLQLMPTCSLKRHNFRL